MRISFFALALVLASGMHTSGVQAADVAVDSKVDAVTVFPRGAEVTRMAQARLTKGAHTIVLNDLPAGADLNSIRVEGKATGTLEIGAVDARRIQVLRQDSDAQKSERRKLEDEIELESDRLTALQSEVETKEVQKRFIENLAGLPTAPTPLAGGSTRPNEDWSQLFSLIGSSMTDIQGSLLRLRIKVREGQRRIEDLKKRLTSLAPQQVQRTEARVNVFAGEDLTTDLLVRYQVRKAWWQPLYDARLQTGSRNVPAKLVLTRRAAIAQSTGETWSEVAVALSTARPSGRSKAPDIFPLTVDFYKPPKPGIGGTMSMQSRDRVLRKSRAAPAPAAVQMQAPATEREASVEIGGYQAVFKVPDRISVDNTGDAKRVKIESFAIEPSLLVRSVPKYDARAYLYAKMSLPKGIAPLIPGQTMLFRDSTYIGKGRLPLLSGGEEHELGFGADDAVRIKYNKIGESRGETGLISSSSTDQRKFKIAIKNLHELPIAFSILDQRPESLNEDIKVELIGRTRPTKENVEDRRGVLAWEGRLAPDQETIIDFGYQVAWPADKQVRYGR